MEKPTQWPAHWTALSELHFATVRAATTMKDDGRFLTRLQQYEHDDDGDMVVPRKRDTNDSISQAQEDDEGILLLHAGETTLDKVGLQLWTGALILAEFILSHPSLFHSRVVLELGAGLALPSLCASRVGAKRVYATDYAVKVLTNCRENIALNHRFIAGKEEPRVRHLDWSLKDLFDDDGTNSLLAPFGWQEAERVDLSGELVLLAADVIYDEQLTDALYSVLERLLRRSGSVLYLSIEKRINFTLEDLAPSARQYDHFFHRINSTNTLQGTRIALDFTQRFHYERSEQLELWRITSH